MDPNAVIVTDRSGRSHVVVKDKRGPCTLATRVLNCQQLSVFTQLSESFGMGAVDAKSGLGPFARGHLILAGNVSRSPGAGYGSIQLEVNVLGVVGGVSDIIARCVFGLDQATAYVDIDEPYDSIQFEARQVVDGLPDGLAPSLALAFSAVGRFWI
jgi:hypothetical protein